MTADRQPPNLLLDANSRFDAASDSAAIAISANSSFQPGASPSPPAGRLESNVSRRCATALSARLAPSKRSALSSIVLIVGLILLLSVRGSSAQERPPVADRSGERPVATESSGAGDLQLFRRVFVLEDQLPELGRGYLPVKRDEFEQLVAAARKSASTANLAPRLTQADYYCRWDERRFVEGRLVWRIVHSGSEISPLTLSGCELPLLNVRRAPSSASPVEIAAAPRLGGWQPQTVPSPMPMPMPTPSPSPSPSLGAWGPTILLRGDASMTASWSWPAHDDGEGRVKVAPKWPNCPVGRLWLDLPDEWDVVPSTGLAVLVDAVTSGDVLQPPPALVAAAADLAPAAPTPGWRRWFVELGGRADATLVFARRSVAPGRTTPPSVRHELSYDITAQGLEMRAQIRIDAGATTLRQLRLETTGGLELGALRLGDVPLRWTTDAANPDGSRQVTVELPDGLRGERTLLVTGLAPLTSGDNWELPVVQCADTQWLETQTQVSVFEPLELNRVQVRGGRQTHVGALATPVPATTFQAQFHAADGRLVVSVAPPPSRLRAIVGSTVTLETSTMTARVVADCTVLAGRLTQLEAELPRAWVVDGVDLDPDALLEDFDVTAIDDERQRLSIRLTAPLTRERTARVLLRAHRPRPADDAWLTRDQFRLLTFVGPAGGAVEGRHLVSVQNDLPAHLHWSDDRDVVWRTPSELTQGEAELVDSRPGNWLYIDDAGAAELAARLAGADGTYSADMALTARVTSGQLSESYRIRLEPRETPVSRVVILFSQARATPPTWSSDSPAAGLFSARRLSDGELQTVSRWAEEGWELQFRASLAEPFTLRMDRSTPWQPLLPLSLIALSEADTQSGGVIVEGEGIRLTIESTGVETRPLASTNPLRVETRVAAFRYDPKNSPLIVLREADDPRGDRRVWAWSSQLGTLVAREGETAHEAVYLLENHGADQIEFSLPHGSRLNQVLVDGQEPPRNAATTDGATAITVALPVGVRFPTLVVRYSSPTVAGWLATPLTHRAPKLAAPVLAARWQIGLSRDSVVFQPWFAAAPDATGYTARSNWYPRIFSLLSSASRPTPFLPQPVGRLLGRTGDDAINAGNRNSTGVGSTELGGGAGGGGHRSGVASAIASFDGESVAAENAELDHALSTLVEVMTQSPAPSTWGVWVERIANQLQSTSGAVEHPPLELRIDDAALARAGVVRDAAPPPLEPFRAWRTPQAGPLLDAVEERQTRRRDARIWLARAGLQFVQRQRSIILTGIDVVPETVERRTGEQFMLSTVEEWMAAPRPARPWGARVSAAADAPWRRWYSCAVSADESPAIWVVDERTIVGAGWVLLIWSGALVLMLARYRPEWVAATPALGVLIALALPDGLEPAGSGVFLGGLVGLALWRFHSAILAATGGTNGGATSGGSRGRASSADATRTKAGGGSGVGAISVASLVVLAGWLAGDSTESATGDVAKRASQVAADEPQGGGASARPPGVRPAEGRPAEGRPINEARGGGDKAAVHRVLYPVDEAGAASGEYLYLPRELYHELRRRQRGGVGLEGVLWREGRYQVELVRDSSTGGWAAPDVVAELEFEALSGGQRVVLPFRREQVTLLDQKLARDGQEEAVAWEPTNEGWQTTLMKAGVYRFTARMRPTLQSQITGHEGFDSTHDGPAGSPPGSVASGGGAGVAAVGGGAVAGRRSERTGFAFSLPRCSTATVTVKIDEGASDIRILNARGASRRDAGGREWNVDLGPAERLAIDWAAPGMAASDVIEVEQLDWLHFRPGAVTLDSRLNLRVTGGGLPRVMRVAFDPRLRWLPAAIAPPLVRQTLHEGEEPWVEFEWDEKVAGAATLNLSFLATGSSGIGLQRLPRVELKDGRPMKHWFAYSAATTLEASRPVGLAPLDITNFVEAWGETSDVPLAAFRLTPSISEAAVGTRYREPRTQGVEATDIGIALGRGRIDYRADLETIEGQLFQLRVDVPADLEVQNVTVIPRDRTDDHVRHWALVGRTLHVQFERPLTGAYRLLVSAEFPLRAGEAQAAPELRLSSAIQVQSRTTRIFRRPGVQVRAAGVPDTMPLGLERGEFVEPWGRLVAAWDDRASSGGAGGATGTTAGGGAPPVTLLAESDPIRGQALVRTALLPRRDGGLLSIQGAVQLETGTLDELRFEVPQDWETPTESSPRGVWTRRPLPTADRQLLILRLQRPLAGAFTFEFRGPNVNVYEGRSAAPDVQLLDVPMVERFCGLPTRARDRRVEWETRGLVAAPLPESGRGLPPLPPLAAGDARPTSEVMSWYRVAGSQFRAVIQEIQGASVEPRVRLADHELFIDSAERIVVVSTLDLEPAGRADAELILPENGRLVQILVDGVPARRSPLGAGRWRVGLSAESWAQRLVVLFTVGGTRHDATQPDESQPNESRLNAVRVAPHASLSGWAAVQSLWTLRTAGPKQYEWRQGVGTVSDARRHDLLRLISQTDALKQAAETLYHLGPQDIATWLGPWGQAWNRTDARLRRTHVGRPPTAIGELAELEAAQADAIRMLGAAESWQKTVQFARTVAEPTLDETVLPVSGVGALHRITELGDLTPSLVPARPPVRQWGRWLAIVAAAVCVPLAPRVARHSLWHRPAMRRGPVIGVILGSIWWLLFPASGLGLIAILISSLKLTSGLLRRSPHRPR